MDLFFVHDSLAAGTKGLVYVGDKIIVYRRDDKTTNHPLELDLPGGGPEGDETPFDTFQREVQEEFKLAIKPDDINYARRYKSTQQPGKFGYFAVAKLPVEAQLQIVFGNEGVEWFLMSPEDYLARDDAWRVFQERTSDYLNSLV